MSIQSVWIIGASTGIGRALALEYAKHPLVVRLIVSARNREKLTELKSEIEQLGKVCTILPLDVTSDISIANAEKTLGEMSAGIDCIVFNAGTCEYMDSAKPDVAMARRVFETNYFGAIEITRLALPLLRAANTSLPKLVYVSSSVTYQSLPRAHAYGASKSALRYFAECMKIDLQHEGIDVHVVSPGFVDTPMTAKNDFDMPFLIESESAAKVIVKGIEAGTFDISFPKRFVWSLKSIAKLPIAMRFKLLGKMSRHEAGVSRQDGFSKDQERKHKA